MLRKKIVTLAVAAATIIPQPVLAQDLGQTVDTNEIIAPLGDQQIIDHGHVDIGLIAVDSGLELKARDDTGEEPVWRDLDDVVFNVGDEAIQSLPDTNDYEFTGASAGGSVWVVPQTEVAGVPWLGWNTQHPTLLESTDQGVTMKILGHNGEGDLALFLQSGGFGAPEVLFSSTNHSTSEFFVELNSHVHANWTFTEPGIHQVLVEMATDSTASQAVLTFAVGAGTDAQQGFNHSFESTNEEPSSSFAWLWWVLALVVVVAIVVMWGIRRGK